MGGMSSTAIVYVGPGSGRIIAATGQHAEAGVPVDVDADVAAGLLEQPDAWQPAPAGKGKGKASTSGDTAAEQ